MVSPTSRNSTPRPPRPPTPPTVPGVRLVPRTAPSAGSAPVPPQTGRRAGLRSELCPGPRPRAPTSGLHPGLRSRAPAPGRPNPARHRAPAPGHRLGRSHGLRAGLGSGASALRRRPRAPPLGADRAPHGSFAPGAHCGRRLRSAPAFRAPVRPDPARSLRTCAPSRLVLTGETPPIRHRGSPGRHTRTPSTPPRRALDSIPRETGFHTGPRFRSRLRAPAPGRHGVSSGQPRLRVAEPSSLR